MMSGPTRPIELLLLNYARSRSTCVEDITQRCRERLFVARRREFALLARAQGYSLAEIARALCVHHTTVMHMVRP